jgi:hypothetical protein
MADFAKVWLTILDVFDSLIIFHNNYFIAILDGMDHHHLTRRILVVGSPESTETHQSIKLLSIAEDRSSSINFKGLSPLSRGRFKQDVRFN